MGPTWGASGADRTQMGPMLAPWTLLSGCIVEMTYSAVDQHLEYTQLIQLCSYLGSRDSYSRVIVVPLFALCYTSGRSLGQGSLWNTKFLKPKKTWHNWLRYACCTCGIHYIDVIMSTMASQITSLKVVYSTVYSDTDQRKHQSSASLALCGEFTGTGEFPAQRASYAENVPIWWRHHGTD